MTRYERFLAARRAERRKLMRRSWVISMAWVLTLASGVAVGWYGRGVVAPPEGALRRPEPHSVREQPRGEPTPQAPPTAHPSDQKGALLDNDPMDRRQARLTVIPGQQNSPPAPAAGQDRPQQAQPEPPALTGSLSDRLRTLVRTAPGQSGIWYYDLTSNQAISVQGERSFTAASTIKVPIVMYLYHLAATNKLSLNRRISVEEEDWADGTGVLQAVPEGSSYSVRELARLAIVHSDNIATKALLRVLGNEPLVNYLNEIGVKHDRDQNLLTPADLGKSFRHLWRMGRRYPKPWEEPLGFLRQTAFNDRLPAGLPPEVPVAHKIGSVDRFFHDGGIVYHPRRPYILVVMTEGMGEKTATGYIGRVSREVWRWQDQTN